MIIFGRYKTAKDATCRLRGIFKPEYYIGVSNDHIEWARRFLRIDGRHAFFLANTIYANINPIREVPWRYDHGVKPENYQKHTLWD